MKQVSQVLISELFDQIKEPHPKASVWIHNGLFFGYPHCCIISICEIDERETREYAQSNLSNRTGFIPCLSCCDKIINSGVTLESLIKDRINTAPFPFIEI